MWKLIESPGMISGLRKGQIIATIENDKFEKFEIRSISSTGYISALHADGKIEFKMFPKDDLFLKWWAEIEDS